MRAPSKGASGPGPSAALAVALVGGLAALTSALCGCAAFTPENAGSDTPRPEIEIEEPLELEVARVDLAHGGLRLTATMPDGSADVAVWLHDDCPVHREVGSGIATRTTLTWTLSVEDLALANGCGLTVRARGPRVPEGRIVKVASIPVCVTVEAADHDGAAHLQAQGSCGTRLVFEDVSHAATLLVGDRVLHASEEEEDDEQRGEGEGDQQERDRLVFLVPERELARALIMHRPLAIAGEEATASVVVGGTVLEDSDEATVIIDAVSTEDD